MKVHKSLTGINLILVALLSVTIGVIIFMLQPRRAKEGDPVGLNGITYKVPSYMISPKDIKPLVGDSIPLSTEDVYKLLADEELDIENLEEIEKQMFLNLLRGDKDCYNSNRPDSQMGRWPPFGEGDIDVMWHLDEKHSGLLKAYEKVYHRGSRSVPRKVKIAHIDTGYDRNHQAFRSLKIVKEQDFIDRDEIAQDVESIRNKFQKMNYGHGSGTLGILAGGDAEINGKKYRIGGNPNAELLIYRATYGSPYNIMDTKQQIIKAIKDAIKEGCDIISFSHGGPDFNNDLKNVVVEAYNAGIVFISAGGNNFRANGLSGGEFKKLLGSPKIPAPAKYAQYTIAVTGATYDLRPYTFLFYPDVPIESDCEMEHMQTSWKRGTNSPQNIIAAYTPNLPFVKIDGVNKMRLNGGGTSGAVPQVAAAVSLYIAKYGEQLGKIGKTEKVRAIRQALFSSARKNSEKLGLDKYYISKYYGNGLLDAVGMLDIPPSMHTSSFSSNPEASILLENFPLIRTCFPGSSIKELEKTLKQLETKSIGGINNGELNFLEENLDYLIQIDSDFSELIEMSEDSIDIKLNPDLQESIFDFLRTSLKVDKETLRRMELILASSI